MKNINDVEQALYNQPSPQPHRGVGENFTGAVMYEIQHNPQPAAKSWLRSYIRMHKPIAIAASLAACLVLGGTAYAATDGFTKLPSWFNIRTAEQQTLENGDKIVSVDTQDCHIEQWDTAAQKLTADDRTYLYRLKSGSALTGEQLVQMVQGNCEFAAQTASATRQSALQTYTALHPEANNALVGGYASETITSITADTLTTTGTMQYNGSLKNYSLTFHHIAQDVVVAQDGKPLTWADLHVGDSIAYVYRATGNALSHAETTPPWSLNTEEATLVYIEKNSPNIKAYFDYSAHFGMDFEQVVPCEHGKDGYCAKYGPTPPARTELDDTPASLSIQDAIMFHNNISATTDPAAIRELHQKTLALLTPELAAKVAASANDSYLLCGQAMTEFFTPQNATQTADGNISRAVLFTAKDGSQTTITYTASTQTNLITTIQCPR